MSYYANVIYALQKGELIPFLGAGVNLFGRDEADDYEPNTYLPSGKELASYLAREFTYTMDGERDLLRVSQYAATMQGATSLYNRLGEVFDVEYPINELHRFLARLPSILKQQGCRHPYQLIVTTNYDDVLEEAFREAKEPFDVVTYVAKAPHQGKFRHIPHGALPREGAELIRLGELKDATGLAVRLRDGADESSVYLLSQFSLETKRALETFERSSPLPDILKEKLVAELNTLLKTGLFEVGPFSHVILTGEAKKLVDDAKSIGSAALAGNALVRVNRLLLEEAFPHEIARSMRSYVTIEDPNTFRNLPFDNLKPKRTVILKIHGAVDRVADRADLPPELLADSFVITEDDYINYLAHTDISKLVPAQLKSKLTNSGFLFLGYGLRDWNLRVIMYRLWGEEGYGYASWAIQRSAEDLDKELWAKRNVRIIEMQLDEYIANLDQQLQKGKGLGGEK